MFRHTLLKRRESLGVFYDSSSRYAAPKFLFTIGGLFVATVQYDTYARKYYWYPYHGRKPPKDDEDDE